MKKTIRAHLATFVLLWSGQPLMAAGPNYIDHIIVGAADLRAAIAEVHRLTGVRPSLGGVHPGRGTRNALMSIGPNTYLELYAPNPAEKVTSPDVELLKGLNKLTPMGWAVSAGDPARLRKQVALGGMRLTEAEPGSRRLPGGAVLRWSTFGYRDYDNPLAPFFISWSDAHLHPSRTSAAGCHLVQMQLFDPAPAKLRRAIAKLGVKVGVRHAVRQRMIVRMVCPKGTITLG